MNPYHIEPICAPGRARPWQYEVIETEPNRRVTATRFRTRREDAERDAEKLVAEIRERTAAKGDGQ